MTSKCLAFIAVALTSNVLYGQVILEHTYDPNPGPYYYVGPRPVEPTAGDVDSEIEIPAGASAYQAALINAHNQQSLPLYISDLARTGAARRS
jgi:hypothetical protein